jgi:hypothetical protein
LLRQRLLLYLVEISEFYFLHLFFAHSDS